MFNLRIWEIISKLQENIFGNIESFIVEKWPDVFWALIILLIWFFTSIIVYRFIIYLFKKFKILELINKLDIDFWDISEENKQESKKKLWDVLWKKIQIDKVVAKASSYYIFLLFFRWSIYKVGITEVEQFLKQLIEYLPNLFIWVVVGYFWIRFANFIYDVIYHSLSITKQKTAKIIASWWKIIILFFTLMVVLNKIWIDTQIINTILTWFIAMLTIAWGLAFGLWWKDIAKEILESFRK
jgi:hypothetical protein